MDLLAQRSIRLRIMGCLGTRSLSVFLVLRKLGTQFLVFLKQPGNPRLEFFLITVGRLLNDRRLCTSIGQKRTKLQGFVCKFT